MLRTKLVVTLLAVLLVNGAASAWGAVADDEPIELLTGTEESLTTSRAPRPTSKIAENVTVITSDDIARINAHTLADVLQTVPGIQRDYVRTPGTTGAFNIQGAFNTQVLVLIDGVIANDRGQNTISSTELIPVQQVDRVEIIKGAASAAWGQALGGVINVITKSPDPERAAGGEVSASMGERFTADSRGELTGTVNRLGYYLSAGNLHSDGLLPNNGINHNNLYGKFLYALPTRGDVTLGLSYRDARRGDDDFPPDYHDSSSDESSYGFLRVTHPFTDRLQLELSGNFTSRDNHNIWGFYDNGVPTVWKDFSLRETTRGASARLTWGDNLQQLVAGLDYEHVSTKLADINHPDVAPIYDRQWDQLAAYANAAVSYGPLTLLPGVRIDHTGASSDYFSYTAGATLRLTDTTVIRGYGAQGYTLPNITRPDNSLQKVITVQGGIESSALPHLWLKGTYFYNRLDNIESTNTLTKTDQIKQGFELEGRTTPLYGFFLTGGYTFLDARYKDTGERVNTDNGQSVPPHSLKLAINYDQEESGLRGALVGNYVRWNASEGVAARDGAMIWDIHLSWKLCPRNELTPELFFSGHNLFNGTQTVMTTPIPYVNPSRWVEGGVRFRF